MYIGRKYWYIIMVFCMALSALGIRLALDFSFRNYGSQLKINCFMYSLIIVYGVILVASAKNAPVTISVVLLTLLSFSSNIGVFLKEKFNYYKLEPPRLYRINMGSSVEYTDQFDLHHTTTITDAATDFWTKIRRVSEGEIILYIQFRAVNCSTINYGFGKTSYDQMTTDNPWARVEFNPEMAQEFLESKKIIILFKATNNKEIEISCRDIGYASIVRKDFARVGDTPYSYPYDGLLFIRFVFREKDRTPIAVFF